MYAAVSGAGAALGLILGGVLTDLLSWRWVFFVNAPIGIALAIGGAVRHRRRPRAQVRRARLPRRADLDRRHGRAGLRLHPLRDLLLGSAATILILVVRRAAILLTTFVVIESRTRRTR